MTITLTQTVDANGSTDKTTQSFTPTNAADLLVLVVETNGGTNTNINPTAVAGTNGVSNTWTQVPNCLYSNTYNVSVARTVTLWYSTAASTTAGTITITPGSSYSTHSGQFFVFEFHNSAGSTWGLDQSGNSGSASNVMTMTGPSLTPTANAEVALYFWNPQTGTISSGGAAGFTYVNQSYNNTEFAYNLALNSSGVAIAPTITDATSTTFASIGVTFTTSSGTAITSALSPSVALAATNAEAVRAHGEPDLTCRH